MKIIELKSENVKRVKAIEIIPKDNVVIISGKNGQGKTSVLDSIWFALEGKALKGTPMPIRKGEKKASVKLTLEDFIITKNWTDNDKSYLKVTNKEGLSYNSPQELLDSFIGRLTFNPLEFAQMSESEQRNLLLKVANIDISHWDLEIMKLREERRLQGQTVKLLSGERDNRDFSGIPQEEISITELQLQLEKAVDYNRDIDAEKHNLDRNETAILNSEAHILSLKDEIRNLEEKKKAFEREIEITKIGIGELKSSADKEKAFISKNEKIEIESIRMKISKALEINELVKSKNRNMQTDKKRDLAQKIYDDFTNKIEEVIKGKETALINAKMPIAGLGISDTGVIYNNIPFSQLSSSEQLKVSMSIAMALNPKLRVIRITDGSLLDDDNMKLIKDMAKDKDYQVWIERISDTGELAFIIEDGRIINQVKESK